VKADGLAKLYDQLTLDERFRLRVRALARRDLADGEGSTAPARATSTASTAPAWRRPTC
jgi:hypothetical protein